MRHCPLAHRGGGTYARLTTSSPLLTTPPAPGGRYTPPTNPLKTTLTIKGVNDPLDTPKVEAGLLAVKGVESVDVRFRSAPTRRPVV